MKKRSNIIRGVVFAIFILLTLITLLFQSSVIIYYGIGFFNMLFLVVSSLALVSALVFAVPILTYLAKENANNKRLAKEENERLLEIQRKKEDVRGLTKDLITQESGFAVMGNLILKDMDEIDEYVERNERLFEFNDMSEFTNMKDIIGSVKSAVYHNCRSTVNLYVALEEGEDFNTEASNILANNQELLDNSKEFLLQMARYTNEQNEDTDAVTTIEGYADAIAQSLKHSYD